MVQSHDQQSYWSGGDGGGGGVGSLAAPSPLLHGPLRY